MVDNLRIINMIDRLIKELYELNITCREERVSTFLELIEIHGNSCDKCNLKEGIAKIDW